MQVIVAEAAPKLQGLTMAKQLTDAGISTLVIPDAAIFALMARVNKVLVGAQAVLGTGGVLAQSGSVLVAQAAKHYRVPFVVVTGAHPPHLMQSVCWRVLSTATKLQLYFTAVIACYGL
jgi:translation initiation factor eIF-2B subunit beta